MYNMDPYPLMIICKRIRNYASSGRFTITREGKHPEWKNNLLPLISNSVVYKQLQFIHPFQYAPELSTAAAYVFRLPFFKYAIYVKIDKDLTKVISFHWDEIAQEPKHLNINALDSLENKQHLQIISINDGRYTSIPIAMGSFVLCLDADRVSYDKCGVETVRYEHILRALENTDQIQRCILDNLAAINYGVDFYNISFHDMNLLSWVNEDKALQAASFLSDVYHANPENDWLRNVCIDIVLANPEITEAMKNYDSSLYPSVETIALESRVTSEESASETHTDWKNLTEDK